MNNELLAVLDYMERERGIDRETLITAVESALLSASKRSVSPAKDLRIEIDRKSCDIRALAKVQVVDKVAATHDEISLVHARRIKPDAQLGDFLEVEVTPKDFGRIAAQTAKQAILHKIRQAEKDTGRRPGATTDELVELKRLKRENAELRRANDILKAAAHFFGAE